MNKDVKVKKFFEVISHCPIVGRHDKVLSPKEVYTPSSNEIYVESCPIVHKPTNSPSSDKVYGDSCPIVHKPTYAPPSDEVYVDSCPMIHKPTYAPSSDKIHAPSHINLPMSHFLAKIIVNLAPL